ncbi:hypothetical protein [Ottowia caeni]|uniref:hypothetical protein n=1 Tax=Ottowia caeni TaxID=2870339 RepID=UPI001E317B97|nr:hypothetical protein [Ottowia caeni]
MWTSALVLAIVFAATLYFERQAMHALSLPFAGITAVLLTLAVTLALGSAQGVWQAIKRKSSPETPPSQWKDGQLILAGGRLKGNVLKRAPWTGREVLFYWYSASARHTARQAGANAPGFRGMDLALMELVTEARSIKLEGVPNPRHLIPEVSFQDEEKNQEAARHLASTSWTTAPEIVNFSMADAEMNFSAVPLHLINRSGRQHLDAVEGQAYSAEHYLKMLRMGRWFYRERVLLPGEEVTVTGTFHDHPPRIDIGTSTSIQGAQHEIRRGLPAATASGNLMSTIVFAAVLAALAVGAHYFVYGQAGAHYLNLLGQPSN